MQERNREGEERLPEDYSERVEYLDLSPMLPEPQFTFEDLVTLIEPGFPAHVRNGVAAAARRMKYMDLLYGVRRRDNPSHVTVDGETLLLPHRHGFEPGDWRETEKPDLFVQAAIASTSNNGRQRHRTVVPLLMCGEKWTMPYLLELASDYVVETLAYLNRKIGGLNREAMGEYLVENPAHYAVVEARINSYWNVYYRSGPKREAIHTYPGFEILEVLRRCIELTRNKDSQAPRCAQAACTSREVPSSD